MTNVIIVRQEKLTPQEIEDIKMHLRLNYLNIGRGQVETDTDGKYIYIGTTALRPTDYTWRGTWDRAKEFTMPAIAFTDSESFFINCNSLDEDGYNLEGIAMAWMAFATLSQSRKWINIMRKFLREEE